MTEQVKIPKRVQAVVARLRAGDKLAVATAPMGGRRQFWWEPGGRLAGQRSVEKAISLGLVVPAGDGLFGDSKTFVAA